MCGLMGRTKKSGIAVQATEETQALSRVYSVDLVWRLSSNAVLGSEASVRVLTGKEKRGGDLSSVSADRGEGGWA